MRQLADNPKLEPDDNSLRLQSAWKHFRCRL